MRATTLGAAILIAVATLGAVPLGAWWGLLLLSVALLVARPKHAAWALAVACIAVLTPQVVKHARDIHYTHTVTFQREISRAQWIAAQVPAGRQLLVQGNIMAMKHRTTCRVADLFNLDAAQVEAMLRDEDELIVAIQPERFATQWAGRAPMQHWAWLQANATVTQLASQEGWVVYRLRR